MSRKCCFVPFCTSTSTSTPGKIFLSVPKNPQKRVQWLKAVRRDIDDLTTSSTNYCCEDHFNLPEDAENWVRYSLCRGRIILKEGVLPHFFNCQVDRKRASKLNKERSAYCKRRRIAILQDAEKEYCDDSFVEPVPSTSENQDVFHPVVENCSDENTKTCCREIGVQVNVRKMFRSKGTNTNVSSRTVALSPIKSSLVDVQTSPIKIMPQNSATPSSKNTYSNSIKECDTNSNSDSSSNEVYVPPSSDSSSEDYTSTVNNDNLKQLCLKTTMLLIQKNPKLYLGVPKHSFYILENLSRKSGVKLEKIFLILKKVKCASPFLIIGDEFGMSERNAAKVFEKFLPVLASYLKELIVWPTTETIQNNLPIPFKARYSKVESIIDCFEIEIEKPSDPTLQALTWSEYKKCNTLKYLISSTPDGIINYVSDGYGGRVTDQVLVENCDYLDLLRAGTCVMADRGFKHIQRLIHEKGCNFVRPPSVSAAEKSSKTEVKLSKQIASLRIHIERVIRRIREFSYLAPHSCINKKVISTTDYVVVLACGLINMQSAIILGN